MDFSQMTKAEIDALTPEQHKAFTKEQKKALKERKRELFLAENADRLAAKKPKLSKAEQRKRQEQQRAAKGQNSSGQKPGKDAKAEQKSRPRQKQQAGERKQHAAEAREMVQSSEAVSAFRAVHLFSHLPKHDMPRHDPSIHRSIADLGLKYARGQITGTDARVFAMLQAFRALVEDYEPPQDQEMSRHLARRLDASFNFLTQCRPHTRSMGNMMRTIKQVVAKLPEEGLDEGSAGSSAAPGLSDDEKKAKVIERVDELISRMLIAAQQIARIGAERISDGDVILTYGYSFAVELLLREACVTSYRLIVVDARPLHEGRHLLHSLTQACPKLSITLVSFGGLSYALQDANKVVLGVDALMSNGAAVARAGTAAVAMAAKARHVPVIVACETYKLSQKVQLDAIVANELGPAADMLCTNSESKASEPLRVERFDTGNEASLLAEDSSLEAIPGVDYLNPLFDVTPIDYISLVVSEAGFMPPTSAPVLLREREDDEM